jgi:thymidylate synthase
MEARGLSHYSDGDIGPMYGYQWRQFNAPYEGCDADYTGKGIDQLQNVIDCLKDPKQRSSRRMVISAWNPCQIDEGVLPPCHVLFQFNVVNGNKLSCCLMQRSYDSVLGAPFNICSYSLLCCLIAKHCDLEPYEFIHYGGNCHIYDDHFDQVKEQLTRTPYEFPTLEILNKRENINDYVVDDFKISNYQHHPLIKAAMRA